MYIALRRFLFYFNSLYDAGHTVVGVEVAEKALRDFFTENNMEYTVKKVNKSNAHVYKVSKVKKKIIPLCRTRNYPCPGKIEKNLMTVILFQSSDGRIRLYCMDFYDFTR